MEGVEVMGDFCPPVGPVALPGRGPGRRTPQEAEEKYVK